MSGKKAGCNTKAWFTAYALTVLKTECHNGKLRTMLHSVTCFFSSSTWLQNRSRVYSAVSPEDSLSVYGGRRSVPSSTLACQIGQIGQRNNTYSGGADRTALVPKRCFQSGFHHIAPKGYLEGVALTMRRLTISISKYHIVLR